MKKNILLSLIVLLGLLFSQCTNNAQHEIEKTLEAFYKTHRTDYRKADKSLLSKPLAELITKASAREDAEAEKTKNSENPTDKPLMIEGDIFTSVYEGQDSLSIGSITINGKQAVAHVNFKNTQNNLSWKDEVVLVNEDGWKIDNVLFKNDDQPIKNTQEMLLGLINLKD